jgi:polyhydroxyalkanoic acid synthase PhaR subunit
MSQESDTSSFADPAAMWKQWQDAWGTYYESSAKLWSNMLEESRQAATDAMAASAATNEQFVPPDPFSFLQQWYESASKSWEQVGGNAMSREQFMKAAGEFLEHYARFFTTLRHMNEEYLKNFQLPTRSDVSGIAELVVELEEKVDQVDDAVENEVAALHKRLERIESKLDQVLTALEQLSQPAPKEHQPTPTQKAPRATRRKVPKDEQDGSAKQPTS